MSKKKWAVARRNKRVHIAVTTNTPNSAGGLSRAYDIKATVWAEVKPLSFRQSDGQYVRGSQIQEVPTHIIVIRKDTSVGIDFLGEEPILGSHYFILLPLSLDRYRVFRIHKSTDTDERGIEIKLLAEEIEEQSSASLIS